MRGVSNKITPSKQLNPIYRGTLNGLCAISAAGMIKDNLATTQAQGNTLLSAATPKGILQGSVVAVSGPMEVGPALAAAGVLAGIVGIADRNSAGEAYESTNSEASGGITYLHGTNTVVEVPVYETVATDGTTALVYTAGQALYASINGLLTNVTGLTGGTAGAGATVVAVLIDPPTTSNPVMTVQLRV
jgi:hypothetical protein